VKYINNKYDKVDKYFFRNVNNIIEEKWIENILFSDFEKECASINLDLFFLFKKPTEVFDGSIKKFNNVIRNFNKNRNIKIKYILFYLDDTYITFSKLKRFLDEENLIVLKNELEEDNFTKKEIFLP